MVEKGLKKGAIFEEDGSFYKVEEVLANGDYNSKRVSKEEKAATEKATKIVAKKSSNPK